MAEAIARQPCDSMYIAHLLSAFLRSEPDTNPTVLPSSRLAELREKASQCFAGQADLLDSIGCLFCICLYCAVTAKFEDESELTCCTLLLQTVAAECLSLFQSDISDVSLTSGGSVQLLNPDETLLSRAGAVILKLNEMFRDGLTLARDLVTDIIKQVRTAHELNPSNKEPKDCLAAHSLYFMCCFGLTHMGIVLKATNNLNAVPGIMESLLVISLSSFSKGEGAPPVEAKRTPPKGDVIHEVRLDRCLALASALGLVAVSHCFDERVLQEIRLVRSRMKKPLEANPAAAYALLQSASFRTYLKLQPNKAPSKDSHLIGAKSTFNAERLLYLDIFEFNRGHFSNPAEGPTSSLYSSSAASFNPNNSTSGDEYSIATPLSLSATRAKANTVANNKQLWKLKKHFRDAFCVLEALRKPIPYRTYFLPSYSPQSSVISIQGVGGSLQPAVGDCLSTLDLLKCASQLEGAYFNIDQCYVPRHLNPSCPLYWAAGHLIEHLYQKTIAGSGFPGSNRLVAQKPDAKAKDKRGKTATVFPSIQSPFSTPSKVLMKADVSSLNTTGDIAVSGNKAIKYVLNLELKLQRAAAEAEAEARQGQLEGRLLKIDQAKRKGSLLLHADDVLMSGMRALQEIKRHQAVSGTRSAPHSAPHTAPHTGSRLGTPSTLSDMFSPVVRRNPVKGRRRDGPLELFLEDPAVRDIDVFRQIVLSTAIGVGLAEEDADAPLDSEGDRIRVSAAWKKNENPRGQGDVTQKKQRWNDGVSAEVAAHYTQSVLDYQNQKKDAVVERAQQMAFELQRDIQLAASRKAKEAVEEKETARRELRECQEFTSKFNEEKKAKLIEKRRSEKLERRRAQAERAQARQYAEDQKSLAKHQKELADKAYKENLLLEKERLKQSLIVRPDLELARRAVEEEKARVQEEEDRVVRAGLMKERLRRAKELEAQQKRTREEVDLVTGRLRMGNFEWHGGVLGFYNDIRKRPVPWVQFTDPFGAPLYYDPISKKSQRRRPTDAPIVPADVDEATAYDVINGEGAYERHFADIAFKDKYNAEEGYYDDNSEWVVATGYYDENYEFIAHLGYYKEGKYILYPRPIGDLSFMV